MNGGAEATQAQKPPPSPGVTGPPTPSVAGAPSSSANGSSLAAKKRKKDALKPIITTETHPHSILQDIREGEAGFVNRRAPLAKSFE
ncbi:hypothetical protein S40288_11325 [Stachybotrys chartarum IBT 40288]|nr:hypothetical protein S40288_11325 [Stachybotrys chartarum IBT 40288]